MGTSFTKPNEQHIHVTENFNHILKFLLTQVNDLEIAMIDSADKIVLSDT